MVRDQYLFFPLGMEDSLMMTVHPMDFAPISIQLPLGQLQCVENRHYMMKIVHAKWQ